jgi:hypothetical protein
VPNGHTAALPHVTIRTPEGAWHRKILPDPSLWKDIFDQIEAGVKEIAAAKKARVHLLAMAPYSLGALLGARLDPQNHKLIVYQPDNKAGDRGQKVWRPWGPAWPAAPGIRSTPFFNVPPGLDQSRPEQHGDIALIVDITGTNDPAPCIAAVQAHADGRAVQSVLLRARDLKPQGTVAVPSDVDKAAAELDHLFQQVAEALPNANLHVFYYGPLAILIRASRGLGFRRTPIIIWEAVYPDDKLKWLPAVEFPAGKLLIDSATART